MKLNLCERASERADGVCVCVDCECRVVKRFWLSCQHLPPFTLTERALFFFSITRCSCTRPKPLYNVRYTNEKKNLKNHLNDLQIMSTACARARVQATQRTCARLSIVCDWKYYLFIARFLRHIFTIYDASAIITLICFVFITHHTYYTHASISD